MEPDLVLLFQLCNEPRLIDLRVPILSRKQDRVIRLHSRYSRVCYQGTEQSR